MDFFAFVSFYMGIAALIIVAISITGFLHSSFHRNIDNLNVTAVKLFRQGKSEEAIDCLGKAIKLNPVCPSSHAILALILSEKQEALDRALYEINMAIKLAPLTGEFYDIRGSIFIEKLHQVDTGQQDLDRAKELGYSSENIVSLLIPA